MADSLRDEALDYHRYPQPGKVAVVATKPLANQLDMSLAYSPGVAFACDAIVEDPAEAFNLTSRGNLVAVITNGTAVLGLGSIGALASKPVMEGKGGLFKKFAGISVFDIEIDETDPKKFIEIVASMEPTFGGINLEDIKAPECFEIEEALRERLSIPIMHDDQHGTAITVGAAVINGLKVVGKDLASVKLVASGAGSAAIACLNLLVSLGLPRENIWVTDIVGVVYEGREEQMDPYKGAFSQKTDARTLDDIIGDADVFLGVSAPGVLKPEMVKRMADKPLILALANPEPEIRPELALEVRPDAILATGRTDYPNQVNNVLCFPYIFRGALDVGATAINEEMKMACVYALAKLAQIEADEIVNLAYGGQDLVFGPDYLIPKPFDPRLLVELSSAVAQAAMESGVATRPIDDFQAYRQRLQQFAFRSGTVMKPVFDQAQHDPKRVVYAEGESRRVLRAVQNAVDEGIAKPILIGRRNVVTLRIEQLNLRLRIDEDFELCDPDRDERYRDYWELYHSLMERRGVSRNEARTLVRTNTTVIASLMVRRGEADAMLCGATGRYPDHLPHVLNVIGVRDGVDRAATVSILITPKGTFFLCDAFINPDPTAEQIANMTILAADVVRRFGIVPKAALLSHSNFGSSDHRSAGKMREAFALVRKLDPELAVEGEMHGDAALSQGIRETLIGESLFEGSANLFIMPSLDAANIAYTLVSRLAEGVSVGPILTGVRFPAHILPETTTARGIVNMTALAVVEAQAVNAAHL
ncbi:MAG: NADP-dependent malic enzyme [Proteobacteria bacterium]|nr:NADP-dependent malic enzyme [Pseudomonadota bacterium]